MKVASEKSLLIHRNKIILKHFIIEKLAYKKWEVAGRPEGNSEEFWFSAEKDLNEVLNAQCTECVWRDDNFKYCVHCEPAKADQLVAEIIGDLNE